ncbi:MAG: 5-methylthioadenosine/S-adenosylhomocysteine deaminase [Solirubrobacterales bacterium]|jgi:5-methylthioadenosine/S-adenosylhomocysteine deaminase|nr:5-methylthioadenosine/S-adenosylhomocysteine deaminase [Solirubrobacterales bacterium]
MGLAVTDATLNGEPVGLRVQDGLISEVGPGVVPKPDDEVLDGSGMALVPGLVNAHTHAAMTLFRGFADDLPLMVWLEEHIWPAEARLEPEHVYWGTRLACAEMIRTGTVAFWDMYWHPEAVARAVEDAGLRAVVAAPLIDGPDPERARADADEALDRVRESSTGRVRAGYAPHALYTVSRESLEWVAGRAAEREATIQIHLSETQKEVEDCVTEHGVRPAFHLDRAGLLGPNTILAHGVWLANDELDLIAERGATVVTNPVANLKLAVGGVFPYPAARERGVEMGIGTDGPGSNNSLDLFSDLKTFALLQKNDAFDAAAVNAAETLRLGMGDASSLLRSPALRKGDPADFLLVRSGAPEMAMGELDAGLVYAASGSVVDATVVAGRVLMKGGVVEGADEAVSRAQECASEIGVG